MMGLWRQFPPKMIEQHLSTQGAAFRMSYAFTRDDPKTRYWFVLNRHPGADEEIVLATTSTQIESRKKARRSCPEVLVFLNPKDYPALEADSVIDCASLEQTTFRKQYLFERASEREIQPLDALPPEVLRKVLLAVGSTKLLPTRLKALILGSDEDTAAT